MAEGSAEAEDGGTGPLVFVLVAGAFLRGPLPGTDPVAGVFALPGRVFCDIERPPPFTTSFSGTSSSSSSSSEGRESAGEREERESSCED